MIEDVNESVGRLMRAFDQWLLSGELAGIAGLVIGDMGLDEATAHEWMMHVIHDLDKPVYTINTFGHGPSNRPVVFGRRTIFYKQADQWVCSQRW